MMDRREFLTRVGVGAAFATRPAFALDTPSVANQFHDNLATKPWLLGFKTIEKQAYQAPAEVIGRIPSTLRGTLYRNGPAQHEFGSFRYQHWFDGDGMVQAFRINDGGVSHQARLVQTRKLLTEKKAGRVLYPGFGTAVPDAQPVTSPDDINPANISVLHHHDRLLALWEAGSPYEINADTLETKGLYSFSSDTNGVPFSAHPRIDQAGNLWNFGYASQAGLLVIWHINALGKLVKTGTIPCDPMSMPHDFIVTQRHIVILIPPLHYESDSDNVSFLRRHTWHADKATRVLVVNKDDLDDHQWLELPAQWVFHFGNGWEDEAGVIRFDGSALPDATIMTHSFSDVMRGITPVVSNAQHHVYQIEPKSGKASSTTLLDEHLASEFPTIDPRVSSVRHNQVVCLTADRRHSFEHGMLNAVSLIDLHGGSTTTYSYPEHQIPEEHLYVPKPGSDHESRGWVMGMALDYRQKRTLLNIFDAQALDAGPVATATVPYALPLGFHGKFVANA